MEFLHELCDTWNRHCDIDIECFPEGLFRKRNRGSMCVLNLITLYKYFLDSHETETVLDEIDHILDVRFDPPPLPFHLDGAPVTLIFCHM